MKNRGLRNRFPEEVRLVWLDWNDCLICYLNGCDVLHRIVSPSVRFYIDGKHNESVYNSCPVHNQLHPQYEQLRDQGLQGFGVTIPCHIGNEAYLYNEEIVKMLLGNTKEILDRRGYIPNDNDKDFLRLYGNLYSGILKGVDLDY